MKKLFLVLGLMRPLALSARHIGLMDLQESSLNVCSYKIWLLLSNHNCRWLRSNK